MGTPDGELDEPPRGFGADHVAVIDSDDPEDLPAVIAARREGYFAAHDAPLWCFVPAIWPRRARAWTPDRRVGWLTCGEHAVATPELVRYVEERLTEAFGAAG